MRNNKHMTNKFQVQGQTNKTRNKDKCSKDVPRGPFETL